MEVGNKEVEKWTFPREERKGELYVVHGARLQGRRTEREAWGEDRLKDRGMEREDKSNHNKQINKLTHK
jgi:hypothetical protein